MKEMNIAIGKTTYHTAKKDYDCMACEWIDHDLRDIIQSNNFTFTELRAIATAKENNWKILKGQRYGRQAMVSDGEFYLFKFIPEIHEICVKYDLYEPY